MDGDAFYAWQALFICLLRTSQNVLVTANKTALAIPINFSIGSSSFPSYVVLHTLCKYEAAPFVPLYVVRLIFKGTILLGVKCTSAFNKSLDSLPQDFCRTSTPCEQ